MTHVRRATIALAGAFLLSACSHIMQPTTSQLAASDPLVLPQPVNQNVFTVSANRLPVWVDTDPSRSADPDDLVALAMLKRWDELGYINVIGVSSTGGNASPAETWDVLNQNFSAVWPLVPGGTRGCGIPVVQAMATALEIQQMDFILLGNATNLASLIECRPELVSQIREVLFVGGRLPGEKFFLGPSLLRTIGLAEPMRDLYVEKDPGSLRVVVDSGVKIRLMPFAAGDGVRLTRADVAPLDQEQPDLMDQVRDWGRTLEPVGGGGGAPAFDPVAVLLFFYPDFANCQGVELQSFDVGFVVVPASGVTQITHCVPRDDNRVKQAIRLAIQ